MLLLEAKVRAREPVQGPQRSFWGSLFAIPLDPPLAISKARDDVAGGESKGRGNGPGPTGVVLRVALRPPLDLPQAISKARDVVAGGKSKDKDTSPGPTGVILGVAFYPPLSPPLILGNRARCHRLTGQGEE